MSDPRQVAAETAGHRAPRSVRGLGWGFSVLVWAVASDARPVLALLSVLSAVVIRAVYVITMSWGRGRSVLRSPWFFMVAALCEVAWLLGRSAHA
jgi:hypothetical protein